MGGENRAQVVRLKPQETKWLPVISDFGEDYELTAPSNAFCKGKVRNLFPVKSNIAAAIAGAIGPIGGSPTP